MKYAVIDIGSNSVRLMLSDGHDTLYKKTKTTRLAEGMTDDYMLSAVAVERTVSAVSLFCDNASNENVEKTYIFATAAARKAKNCAEFISKIKNRCGIEVDVVSGETEAKLGYLGALGGGDGGIVDVGGASTEVSVVTDGVAVYSKSVDMGAVTVTDKCGQDQFLVRNYVEKKASEYGNIPLTHFCAIGGTATSIASMLQELEPYDPTKADGYVIEISYLKKLKDRLFSLSVEDRVLIKGLQPERAKVIASGVSILLSVMNLIGINSIKVSEKDNLEGYLKSKLGRL